MGDLNLGELVPLGRDVLGFIRDNKYLVAGVIVLIVGLIAWSRKSRGAR